MAIASSPDEIYSMMVALEFVCEKLKIASDVIKAYAECEATEPEFDGKPNDKLVEQYTELFSKSAQLN